jgi:hypothetical protein
MESLFKFVLHRPPVRNKKDLTVDLSQNTDFQAKLATSIGKKNPRKILKEVSEEFAKGNDFINDVNELKIYNKVIAFKEKLDELTNKEKISQNELKNAVKDAFGTTVAATTTNNGFLNAIKKLKDSIITIKYLPELHKNPIEELANGLRDLEIVLKIDSDASALTTGSALKRYRRRSLKLPTQAELKSILTLREEERKRQEEVVRKRLEEKKKEIKAKAKLYRELKYAIKEIMGLNHDLLESTPQKASRGFVPPKEMQPLHIFKEEINRLNTMGQLKILNAKTLIEKGNNADNILNERGEGTYFKAFSNLKTINNLFAGSKAFRPATALSSRFRFQEGAEKLLSKRTLEILKARGLSITELAIDKIIAVLKEEMNKLSSELEGLTVTQRIKSMKRVGKAMVVMNIPRVTMWGHMPDFEKFPDLEFEIFDNRIPKTKGSVSPSGIADLIIVKQQLKGYEGKDVAHIENVLKGELKVRDHRRFNQTISDTISETETIKVEERELESTDRFELSRETSETIQTDASLKAGLTISGSYGPSVSFSSSVEGAYSSSKEEATKMASNFSKEVTQRSVERLSERIRQSNRIIVTNEVEETNNHTLDNVGGSGHISGVYQWVEKLYEAQMFNYGIRMMFDFMIPEPGAYIVEAMQEAHASAMEIEKPLKFSLRPNYINDENYNFWVHEYGAKGITPPPEEYITKSYNYNAGEGDKKTDYQNSGVISIDDGYVAVQASMGLACTQWSSERIVDVVIGRRTHRFSDDGNWMWITTLNDETESIPLGFITNDLADIAVGIEIKCKRTDYAYRKWQLDTHAKLMDAYQAKLADYEERLAALELQAGVEIEGKNPGLNMEIMKDELKKNCISILTDQHFDLFDAIDAGTNGLAQINLYENEAEGPYVRFFEQAFEWEHITWLTYPYFWGRKNKWEERIAYDDPDPLFNQFIKAGYCRAVIPVRPGFEGAIDHFMTFGEIWNGGPLPAISSDLYLPIADEIAERLDRPGDEIPQGDPWEVSVPTNLVKLRPDDQLPRWEKDEDGNWNES